MPRRTTHCNEVARARAALNTMATPLDLAFGFGHGVVLFVLISIETKDVHSYELFRLYLDRGLNIVGLAGQPNFI